MLLYCYFPRYFLPFCTMMPLYPCKTRCPDRLNIGLSSSGISVAIVLIWSVMPSVEIVNFFPLAVVVVRRTAGAAFYNILCEVENLYVGRWLHDERLSGLY